VTKGKESSAPRQRTIQVIFMEEEQSSVVEHEPVLHVFQFVDTLFYNED